MPTITLTTFKDLTERMLDYLGASSEKTAGRDARYAVLNAYRELASAHRWSYFYQRGRVSTVASYSTGTIDYDHCVTPEHEALTRSGWKTFDKLIIGEEILAYDHEFGACRWKPLQDIHTTCYRGELMDVVRKGRVVLRCTAGHRHPVYKRVGSNKSRCLRNAGFVRSDELTAEHCVPLMAPVLADNESPLTPRQAAILGWAVTDGYGLLDKDKDYLGAITQSPTANPENCKSIAELLGTMQRGPYRRNAAASWRIQAKTARGIRRIISKTSDLPSLVTRLSVDAAAAMYEAMLAAEGSCTSAGRLRFSQWNENHKPIAEAFQILALLLGHPANLTEREFDDKTRYDVPVRTAGCIKPAKQSRWTDYSGLVWCPRVSTGAWVVRCNGAVMITGNSGGTFERQLTLASGTWPTWANFGQVVIANVTYQVATRESGTVLTLSVNSNPGADVAASTTYTLYRDSYPLPADCLSIEEIINVSNARTLELAHPGDWLRLQRTNTSVATPAWYSIFGSPDHFGAMNLAFYPPPDAIYQMDFIYHRRPRPLLIESYSAGTVSVTANSSTVTGTGTTWTSSHVGSVLRLSANTTDTPTPLWGANPYSIERTITAVASATSLTVDSAITTAHTGVKYVVSDPIDIEEGAMLTALLRCCEKQEAICRIMKNAPTTAAAYREALILAREADSRSFRPRHVGGNPAAWRLGDMPKGSDISN